MDSAPNDLQASLAAALAYFDVFNYPLTLAELRRFRARTDAREVSDPSFAEILEALAGLRVGEREGFYHLEGRESVVDERRERYRLADRKFSRARRFAGFLSWMPSIRLVAVCNSLSLANAIDASDIDLIVVARPGTLWITRLVAVGTLALLGLRPEADYGRDRLCLSFFVAESALDLSGLRLPLGDVCLPYWIATFLPLYDAGGVMERLYAANSWIRARIPGVRVADYARGRLLPRRRSPLAPLLPVLRALEAPAKRLQFKLFPECIRRMMNRDTRVVVTDDVLKFHVDDRREEQSREFQERLATVRTQA